MTGESVNLEAVVYDVGITYRNRAFIEPVKHDYGDGTYKYTCPICESLGFKFQLTEGDENCFCCGVHLHWPVLTQIEEVDDFAEEIYS